MWLCSNCDQPVGALHLDTCPHKRPFGGAFVSITQATKETDKKT